MTAKAKPAAVPRKSAAGRREAVAPRHGRGCPIVGVGASAGGLEAFTRLLKQLPPDTGFGFVLVQHLDPQHESALTQLLARATTMPVREATNNLRVQPNHVYVIPPNTRLGIAGGVLKLQPRSSDRAAPRSIDFFFEALASDQHERAIGVILSGTATDGTLGLEAIKAEAGLTFAQDSSARYDSMPRSAIAAGCVDLVLSPEDIAKELSRIAKHPYIAGGAPGEPSAPPARQRKAAKSGAEAGTADPSEDAGYREILLLLRNHCGVDFSSYRSTTIRRRILRRTVLNRRNTLENYAEFLRDNAKELDALHSDVLINVTSFFRNPEAFDALRQKVLAQLLQPKNGDNPLRVWVLGCSTGQEAYSIAMAYAEAAEKIPRARPLQMFATDLNDANLAKARRGHYAKGVVQDISPERLKRFFVPEDDGYRVIKPLRELVVFARQNVISDPPFSRMDLISCRNLMIYLEPSLQKKVLPNFHYALNPGGFLFLGASESIGPFTDLFMPVDKKQKIFSKVTIRNPAIQLPAKKAPPASPGSGPTPRATHLRKSKPGAPPEPVRGELTAEREADRVTVNRFAPPGVLINSDLQILQFRGSTGAYLEAPTGKATFDLLKMARDGLMLPLRSAINSAKRENRTTRVENVRVEQNGKTRTVDVEVVPLRNLTERCFLVLFDDAERHGPTAPNATAPEQPATALRRSSPTRKNDSADRIASLERDLAEARDYLQSTQELQAAAHEELQAANEEGQSANEELQSLNEELETSKEELESTNEELTTVNEEMENRNAELNRVNSDLTNLQTSTNLAIVLLGRDLTIRRYSAQAEKRFNLLPGDVGRPIGEIRHNLSAPDFERVIAEVISTERESEHEVQDRDGHWYSLRVRPYLSLDRKVDGAVVILVDIDELKRAARLVSEQNVHAEAIIRTVPDPLVILTADLRLQSANDAFYRTFKVSPKEATGRVIFELDHGSWDIAQLHRLLEDILPQNSFFDDFEITHDFARVGHRSLLVNARMLKEPGGKPKEILLGIHDFTLRKEAEEALRKAQAQLAEHAVKLESLVLERTAELTASNRQLEASVASIHKGKEAYRALFLESQIMQKKLRLLTHQILTTQEEERKKISRELHDEVVQTLVGINVELSALGKRIPLGAPNLKKRIARTQRLVANSVDAVHRFARGLRPAVLDDLGLIPALHAYCRSLTIRKRLRIQITAFRGVEAVGGAGRTALFRVAQEALTNVVRHAHATHVRLNITALPGAIRMEIHDNGTAFDVAKVILAKSQRLGLVGMRERIEMVGGSLTIESAPGHGTNVYAEIPFNPKKRSK